MDARLPRRLVPGERLSRRVLLAHDALDGPVAVKLAEGPDSRPARELAREFERLASLRHPAFPRALAFGFLDDGRAWMSQEPACGELATGPLPVPELLTLAEGLCEALAHLHARHLVHRDLKPDHVRFDAATGRVMVLDLGSATPAGLSGPRVGTPGYVAPEIVAGRRVDARADLYGLGAVLYELAAGRPAFPGAAPERLRAQRDGRRVPLREIAPGAPPELAALIELLLSPDPDARPESAESCRARLRPQAVRRGETLGEPPLAGRDREMDALLELAERARHAPVAATLAGPPGSGRTALLDALRVRLLLQGVPVLRRSLRDAPSLRDLARAVSLVLDAPVGAAPGAEMDEIRAALEGAARALDGHASLRAPLALLLDDAADAPASSREALAALARKLPAGVLLVVADGARGETLEPAGAARVDLGPLPEGAVRHVLEAVRRAPAGEDLVRRALATSCQPGAVIDVARRRAAAPAATACGGDEDPQALLRQGRIAAAVAAWQARHLSLPESLPGERAHALARLGHALWVMAEPADALARAEAAQQLAASCGDAAAEAEAARVLGRIYGSFGSTRDGVGWQRRALEIAAEHDGVPRHEALTELGLLMMREGHVEAATRALTEAVREAETQGDPAGAAVARARLGRARLTAGDHGAADRLLRRALSDAKAAGDCLGAIEAQRLLATALGARGELEEALPLLEAALAQAADCGAHQELPALHQALAQVHLQGSVRLRTQDGAIVDRRRLEVARAHVEKGLDLALATARMDDRAALAVVAARCALLVSDAKAAQAGAEEAHLLALDAGDLLVASQARLVKAEALLDLREFGVALAEARIAGEAFTRSGVLEDAWRAHALLARIHGAWGMPAKQAQETEAAARLLHQIEATLRDPRARRAYMGDVERAAALAPPAVRDASKARRGTTPELAGSRFAGRADTEDLVDALIKARQRTTELERRLRTTRVVARDARLRRDALLRASALAASPGAPRAKDMSRVLEMISRACGGARLLLATSQGGRLRVRGAAGARQGTEAAAHEAALVVARRVIETGRGSLALGALGNRRTDPPSGDVHVALPLEHSGDVFGALVVRSPSTRSLRRADVRLLRAAASLLSLALVPAPSREEAPV